LTIDGEALPLRQLHFHLPSEHVRGGILMATGCTC
jgi:carbonic anhydrase